MAQAASHTRRRQGAAGRAVWALLVTLAVSVAALAGSGGTARAEEPSPITKMRVSLWPEYDDPRLLVLFEGEYAADVSLPRKVRFRLPQGAEVSQVCALTRPANEHLCQQYETEQDGDSLVLSFTIPTPAFFLEFYYDAITGATDKGFVYEFRSFDHIDELEIEVQQPLGASDFRLEPTPDGVTTDSHGFKNHRYSFADVAPEQSIALRASYIKPDSRPSVSADGTQGSGGLTPGLLVGAGGALAAGIGLLGLVRYRNRRPAQVEDRRSASTPRAAAAASDLRSRTRRRRELPAAYCTQCGLPLEAEDNFCSNCGAERKRR